MLTKRPCCVCRRWFLPDRRVGRRQRACSASACQIARRAWTQASWRRRNPDYFIAHRVQRRRLRASEAQGMEERYRRRPTIITTNLDYPEWQTFLGNKALVDALLSRLRHQCHTIRIDGPSLRDPQG